MPSLLMDLRQALRAIRRSPVLFLSAALSIAVGVGANTAVFSWMDSLVLHPFPGVVEPERVVGIETRFPARGEGPTSYPAFRDLRDGTRTVSGMAVWSLVRASVRTAGEPAARTLVSMATSGNYFEVLGGRAHIGRTLTMADERARSGVLVLGYEAWQREHAADPAILGQTLFVNGEPFTVVGVAAPRFVGTYLGVVPDLFIPVTVQPRITGVDALEDRTARSYQVVARLAPGATVEQARREMDALALAASARAGDRPALGAQVREIRRQFLGALMLPLFSATLVVTALLLLVACANVAGLLLVRSASRSGELSVRTALGASGAHIARLALVDSAVLAVAGGVMGVAMAWLTRGVLASFAPTTTFPITLPIAISGRVLLFALGAATLVTAACAVMPALRMRRASPAAVLRSGSQTAGTATARMRFAIVAAQIAISLVCLVTAGYFLGGLRAAAAIDPGFEGPDRVLLVNTDLSQARLTDSLAVPAIREILAGVRRLPGVAQASAASSVPLGFGGRRLTPVRIDGYDPAPQEDMSMLRLVVGGDYAHTMGIRVVAGRDFTDADRADAEPSALVNETFARRFAKGGDVIGRRIDAGRGWARVVGVLRDGRYTNLTESPQPAVYVPLEQWPQPAFVVHVRTTGDPLSLAEAVRGALRGVHVDLPALQVRTLANHISAQTVIPNIGASILSTFGAIALGLAAVGLYAALAQIAALRSREIGIRLALGAGRRNIAGTVARPAARIAATGIAIGVALSVLMALFLRARVPMLASISPWDPRIWSGGLAVMLLAIAASAWRPTVRATRIDPASVLRDG